MSFSTYLARLRRVAPVAVAAAVLTVAANPAAADILRAHYTVTLVGLPLGTAGLTGTFTQAGYQIDVNAKLTGLAGLLTSFKGAATAAGALANGRVSPTAYSIATSNGELTRTVRMSVAGGAVKTVVIQPPIEERPDRVPVTDADRRGIVDPISALVMPVAGSAPVIGPLACNRNLPVFDGYARFTIALSYVGEHDVTTQGYSGPAAVCSARYIPVAGHRRDRKGTQFMADNRELETWLAPVGNTRVMVPIRISVKTMIGTTVIEASEFVVDPARKAAASAQ